MARSGSFRGGLPSLRPFGGGGGFGQYAIGNTTSTGENLADLKRYQAEVAWGNGQLSDAAYLDVLKEAIDAAPADSSKRVTAQNKYDDAVYTIGRGNVAAKNDLDALIAFDQSSLARMQPGNERYTNLQGTLATELANRRSRDYSALVDDYNAGKATTQSLIDHVNALIGSLPANAPDKETWQTTLVNLQDRAQTEKDATVFQDYQHGRLNPDQFLAYVTQRRDAFLPGSPSYEDWARKLEDAQTQVDQNAKSKADAALFADYNAGKIGDAAYLTYIRDRIAGMKPDDPTKPDWERRLATATFSIAEDKLRLDVAQNKRPASDLAAFYTHYQATLDPTSPEWRTIQGRIDEAKRADFAETESQLNFKVSQNLASPQVLVDFYTKRLGTLPKDSPEWRAAFANLEQAKGLIRGDAQAIAQFKAQYPGVAFTPTLGNTDYTNAPHKGTVAHVVGAPTSVAGGRGESVPTGAPVSTAVPTGNFSPPAGARFGGLAGGHYSPAEVAYVANRISQLTGLDPAATRIWVMKEEGGGNNPLGVSGRGSAGNSGIRANFNTIDEGIAAAAEWINTHGNMASIKNSVGKSAQEQIAAIDRSPWGPGGGRGGYNGSLEALAGQVGYQAPANTTAGPLSAPGTDHVPTLIPGSTPPPAQPPAELTNLVGFWQQQLDAAPNGTKEWRNAYAGLQSAKNRITAWEKAQGKAEPVGFAPTTGKAISPKFTIETALAALALTPDSNTYQMNTYTLNHDELKSAYKRGDKVWLFTDPTNPNAVTYMRNPDGTYALDSKGQRQLTRGSVYLPVTGQALAHMEGIGASYYYQLSEAQRAAGKYNEATASLTKARTADDQVRLADNRTYLDSLQVRLQGDGKTPGLTSIIDHAMATGDLATVVNATTGALQIIQTLHGQANIDDTRKDQLATIATGLAANPLFPDPANGRLSGIDDTKSIWHLDDTGHKVYDQVSLTPGYHLAFKMDKGVKSFEIVTEDGRAPGEYQQTHLAVSVLFGDRVVTADATIDPSSPVNPLMTLSFQGLPATVKLNHGVMSASFFDGSGHQQTMYSLDGVAWIRPNAGLPPVVSLNATLSDKNVNGKTGAITYFTYAAPTGAQDLSSPGAFREQPVITVDPQGNVRNILAPDLLEWHGQTNALAGINSDPFSDAGVSALYNRGADAATIRDAILRGSGAGEITTSELGAPGQHMTLAFADATNTVNMLPPDLYLRPDWTTTGGFNSPNDLLGKSVTQIAAMDPKTLTSNPFAAPAAPRAPTVTGIGPGAPVDALLSKPFGVGYQQRPTNVPLDSRVAILAQLPPTTPPRINGTGAVSPGLVPPRAIAPRAITPLAVSPTRLAPAPITPTTRNPHVITPLIPPAIKVPKPTGLAGEGPKPPAAPKSAIPVVAPATERTPKAPVGVTTQPAADRPGTSPNF